MKLGELEDKIIYAYRPRTSDNSAQPAKVVEAKLWRHNEVFANWDGGAKRTKQTVVKRAVKGDRAGRSNSWSATTWAIGVPVLVIEASDHQWVSSKTRIAELPFVIFSRAWAQMNPHKLVEDGYDGRFKDDVQDRTSVEVSMSDGTTRNIVVRLEFVRPQALIQNWNPYLTAKKEAVEREAQQAQETSRRKMKNNLMAASIRDRVDALVGEARHDDLGERSDIHRKYTSTGISTTYEVGEELLLKLLTLAEKGSSQ